MKGHWAKKRIIFGCKVLGAAVSAAETYAWHDSEMKEINSLLCKYMRVMLRGRAKTVEDGRVRQWSNQRLHEALRKNGFQSLFVSQSEAWEALQRMDTSLLRAACWTMASGMKLEKNFKALCGDDCKIDWCCEILSVSGVPCGLRFRSKKH